MQKDSQPTLRYLVLDIIYYMFLSDFLKKLVCTNNFKN